MEVKEVVLPLSNRLADDYVNQRGEIQTFFEYDLSDQSVYEKRKEELGKRSFPREELVAHLLSFHKRYEADDATIRNIKRLKDEESLVVIGGQQAGLLTGPLYTIHKILSILKLAEEQEKALGVPVIPVFWIAGEDHDFAEINHVCIDAEHKPIKSIMPQRQVIKEPVSDMKIDPELCRDWIKDIVRTYEETNHTNEILSLLERKLDKSETFVDFFAHLILELFKETGIVLLDSNHPEIRKIEAPFFKQLIEQNHQLRRAVHSEVNRLKAAGYPDPVQIPENTAHLFYHLNGERVLLEWADSSVFCGKQNECQMTTDELIKAAETQPESLSNNVLTRPLMQEYVFPVLGFISGPGEVAYWAVLKEAFRLFGFATPPVVPRHMITIVGRATARNMEELSLPIDKVLQHGTEQSKLEWLEQQKQLHIDDDIDRIKKELDDVHATLRSIAEKVDPGLREVANKNGSLIQEQLNYLQRQIDRSIQLRYDVQLRKYDRIEHELRPGGSPQERIWNIYPYLNEYGLNFVERLLECEMSWEQTHKVIFV